MIARISFLFALFACLSLPTALAAKSPDIAAVDALVRAYGNAGEPGISVAIAKDGELIYEGWTGQADLERGVAISRNTRFHIASITKQFTVLAIMQLVDEGAISLDQQVSDFFPQMHRDAPAVTIRHLLDHTSGLREVNTLLQMLNLSEAAPVTTDQSLALILRQRGGNFAPGTQQEYSNTGYQLLAQIVARASGRDFADYMQAEVFAPLGMDQSFVRTDPQSVIENVATGYDRAGDGFAHTLLASANYGSTGIISTPRDLLRWGHALNTGALGGPSVAAMMAQRTTLPDGTRAIATNGQEFRDFRGLDSWSHGGSTGGFRSFLLRFPEEGVVITVMGNRGDFLKAAFAFDVAEALLTDRLGPAAEPDMTPQTTAQLDSYTGDYRLFPGVVFSLRRDGDALTFSTFGEEGAFPLPRVSKGVFMLNPSRDLRLEFRDFEDGRASQMRWQVSEDGFLRARRVNFEPVPDAPKDLSAHTGSYYSSELQIGFDIIEQEGQLMIVSSLHEPVRLIQYQPDVFRPAGSSPFQRIKFVTDDQTEAANRIVVSSSLAEGIVFEAIE